MTKLDLLKIERLGGLGRFGLSNSHLRSEGDVAVSALSEQDQKTVEELFSGKLPDVRVPDGFRYRITRKSDNGDQTIEVAEAAVPESLRSSVKDELV